PVALDPVVSSVTSTVPVGPAMPADPAPVVGPVSLPALPPQPEPVTYPARLRITATSGAQVTLRRDGRLVFEGRLPPGKYLDWRGTSFVLHASNPKGLRVELAGRPVDLATLRPEPDGSWRLGKK
ncbi:MAG: hypothetical protein FD126_2738, partial [Elusimicrobia bacterium]